MPALNRALAVSRRMDASTGGSLQGGVREKQVVRSAVIGVRGPRDYDERVHDTPTAVWVGCDDMRVLGIWSRFLFFCFFCYFFIIVVGAGVLCAVVLRYDSEHTVDVCVS